MKNLSLNWDKRQAAKHVCSSVAIYMPVLHVLSQTFCYFGELEHWRKRRSVLRKMIGNTHAALTISYCQ